MALVVHSAKLWDDASSTGNSIDDSTTCIVTRAIQIDAAVASRFLANEHHDSTSMNGRSDHTDFSAALDSIANDTRTSIVRCVTSRSMRGTICHLPNAFRLLRYVSPEPAFPKTKLKDPDVRSALATPIE